MKKTVVLDDYNSFYRGYKVMESMRDGGPITVEVACGCAGQMIPGNKFRMELCPTHDQATAGKWVGVTKWLPAMWLLSANRNGISSCEVARGIGVTQKTAWFMLQRLHYAMQTQTFVKLDGKVEVDETYFGGKVRHRQPGLTFTKSRGPMAGKAVVMGIMQRQGHVIPPNYASSM